MAGKGNISAYIKVKSLQVIRAFKKPPSYKKNIYVFCEEGSKGEELIQILRKLPHLALLNEPFKLGDKGINPLLNLGQQPYIPEEMDWDEAKREFIHLLAGNRLSADLLSLSSLREFAKAKRLVIQETNGAAILPWLTRKLSLITPPIYWLRHPIPTCLEQLDRGLRPSPVQWGTPRSEFADYWERHRPFLQQLKSPFERQLAQWCLHNRPSLKAQDPTRFIRVCYENFLLNGRLELQRVLERIDLPMPSELLNGIYNPPDAPLGTWKYKISKTEKERAQRILNYFSIDLYSADSPYPLHKEAYAPSEESLQDFPLNNYPIFSNPV